MLKPKSVTIILFILPLLFLLSGCGGGGGSSSAEEESEGFPKVSGRYSFKTEDFDYECTTGEKGTTPSLSQNFKIIQDENQITIVGEGGNEVPGVTIFEFTNTTGNVERDGSFIATKQLTGEIDGFGPITASFHFEGKFQDEIWNGKYTYTVFFTELSEACDYSTTFSGIKLEDSEEEEPSDTSNDITTGLVLHLPISGDATDSSGNGLDGSVNGAILTTDRNGNSNSAYQFDGTDDYIEISDSASLDLTSKLTIVAWIFTSEDQEPHLSTDGGIILNKENSYEVAIAAQTNTIKYAFWYTDKKWAWIDTGININLNEWNLIVITFDSNKINTYLNSKLVYEQEITGELIPTDYPLGIGARYLADEGADHWIANFKGIIDEIRLYNRVLSSEEIETLFLDE